MHKSETELLQPRLLFIFLLFTQAAIAEVIPATFSVNPKVDEIYFLTYKGETVYVRSWQQACESFDLTSSTASAKYCINQFGNAVYPQHAAVCADGSLQYPPGEGSDCAATAPSCPDASWTLSEDQKTCERSANQCVPNIRAVSEETLLAAIAYGEASTDNNYQEMAAIASATLRARDAHGMSLARFIKTHPGYSKAVKHHNQRYTQVMCDTANGAAQNAFAAAQNALTGGYDYANGGCFWDGVDLKTDGENHYRYRAGFKFTSADHNIFSVNEPLQCEIDGRNGSYDHVYESTASYGKSVFWKYNADYLQATGVKQCT